jgi:secondary thiamine-phosphate synthase enzyme
MKAYTEYLTIHTEKSRDARVITEDVKAALKKSEFTDGLILVGALHPNAAVTHGLKEPKFLEDLDAWLAQAAPARDDYQLGRLFESNASTVLQSILAHPQITVAFTEGRLDLGPWQEILYLDFDGQRPKRVVVKLLGE